MKVFIIESPSPNDLLEARNERNSLVNMCKMFNYQASSFFTYSKEDFETIIKYLCNVNLDTNEILCLHISCHGNTGGICIGADFINWLEVTQLLLPVFNNKKIGKQTFIVISSCGASGQEITHVVNSKSEGSRKKLNCPSYIFVSSEETVQWDDSLLCWSILYHQLSKLSRIDRKNVQVVLRKIAHFGNLLYFRWDEEKLKYLKFNPV